MEQTHGVSDGNINISDVIEVIQTDPGFVDCQGEEQSTFMMYSGGGVENVGMGSAGSGGNRRQPYVNIIEQPASKALRFRYECEGRSAGSIPGVNSTPENKTFPKIQVENHTGRAIVVVSCVTKDPPYRPHPHNLVGKESCDKGICTLQIPPESMTVTFSNLGIQCVKKKDIEEALKVREEIRVDPFRTGFSHRTQPTGIDLNAVRLCFQVFLESTKKGKFSVALQPVVSDPIYDKKAMSDLVICKLSDCCCTVAGGKEIILLCEKVAKEDIKVRFFEERDGQVLWEGFADFQPMNVHKQVAITFRTPRYRTLEVDHPVKVFIQLLRPTDGATSEPLAFEFLPLDSDTTLKRKRKYTNESNVNLLRHFQAEAERHGAVQYQAVGCGLNKIKIEPADHGLSPFPVESGTSKHPYPKDDRTPLLQPSTSMLTYRQPISPGRTPSPMIYPQTTGATGYNIQLPHIHQQLQQQPYGEPPMFQQLYMHHPQDKVDQMNTEHPGSNFPQPGISGIQNPVENIREGMEASNISNMDSQQSAPPVWSELPDLDNLFSVNLAQNLSSNLPLPHNWDSQVANERMVETETATYNDGNENSVMNSFERLTTATTMQGIRQLNEIFNPTRDNNG
ncbi:dorsal protein isoform X2 [Neodiprion pinetum]|uniref:Proto-oncogene c-Rel isoform X2 n=1 Tax=Neodiprion lecontei TaxID=441921 RepID=A0ABM3FS98_NEOLC|nr:proto-oncogene c-Rel-like isoform X2 [Neodiprion pinetum]XP_046590900.1 proto-oncogene c-Rel isoform X2 [Neodiprion lecontei]